MAGRGVGEAWWVDRIRQEPNHTRKVPTKRFRPCMVTCGKIFSEATPCLNVVPFRTPSREKLPCGAWGVAQPWFRQVLRHLQPDLIICNGNGESKEASAWAALKEFNTITAQKPIHTTDKGRIKYGHVHFRPIERRCRSRATASFQAILLARRESFPETPSVTAIPVLACSCSRDEVKTFGVTMGIGDVRGERFEEMEALVDTGATTTVIPGAALRRLGIAPTRRETFEYAGGQRGRAGHGRGEGGEWRGGKRLPGSSSARKGHRRCWARTRLKEYS